MAAPKSKSGIHNSVGQQARTAGKSIGTAFFVGPDQALPKGVLKVPDTAFNALLQTYRDAITQSRTVGRSVSFRVEVDPEGETVLTPVEDVAAAPEPVEEAGAPDAELAAALAAARARGRLRAAEILGGDDMLSADAFAKMLGTTRMTVNTKRQSGQVLGLDGAKRGFRFPVWQLDAEGKPYAALAVLHERLGGPWAVYRFLVQPHGELDGLTGREALERGKVKAALEAAESVGRDFR